MYLILPGIMLLTGNAMGVILCVCVPIFLGRFS